MKFIDIFSKLVLSICPAVDAIKGSLDEAGRPAKRYLCSYEDTWTDCNKLIAITEMVYNN